MNSIKVCIPSYKFVEPTDGKAYHTYTIMVNVIGGTFVSNSRVHFIERRYSDFLGLHNSLRRHYNTPEFPPKRVRNSRTKVLESRRISLEHYLQIMVSVSPVPTEVLDFLQLPNQNQTYSYKSRARPSIAENVEDATDFGFTESFENSCTQNPAAAFFEDPFLEDSDSNSNLSDTVTRGVLDALYH